MSVCYLYSYYMILLFLTWNDNWIYLHVWNHLKEQAIKQLCIWVNLPVLFQLLSHFYLWDSSSMHIFFIWNWKRKHGSAAWVIIQFLCVSRNWNDIMNAEVLLINLVNLLQTWQVNVKYGTIYGNFQEETAKILWKLKACVCCSVAHSQLFFFSKVFSVV